MISIIIKRIHWIILAIILLLPVFEKITLYVHGNFATAKALYVAEDHSKGGSGKFPGITYYTVFQFEAEN